MKDEVTKLVATPTGRATLYEQIAGRQHLSSDLVLRLKDPDEELERRIRELEDKIMRLEKDLGVSGLGDLEDLV